MIIYDDHMGIRTKSVREDYLVIADFTFSVLGAFFDFSEDDDVEIDDIVVDEDAGRSEDEHRPSNLDLVEKAINEENKLRKICQARTATLVAEVNNCISGQAKTTTDSLELIESNIEFKFNQPDETTFTIQCQWYAAEPYMTTKGEGAQGERLKADQEATGYAIAAKICDLSYVSDDAEVVCKIIPYFASPQ